MLVIGVAFRGDRESEVLCAERTSYGSGISRGMMVRTAGIEPARASPRDFKSLASTSFATSALPAFSAVASHASRRYGRQTPSIRSALGGVKSNIVTCEGAAVSSAGARNCGRASPSGPDVSRLQTPRAPAIFIARQAGNDDVNRCLTL